VPGICPPFEIIPAHFKILEKPPPAYRLLCTVLD